MNRRKPKLSGRLSAFHSPYTTNYSSCRLAVFRFNPRKPYFPLYPVSKLRGLNLNWPVFYVESLTAAGSFHALKAFHVLKV